MQRAWPINLLGVSVTHTPSAQKVGAALDHVLSYSTDVTDQRGGELAPEMWELSHKDLFALTIEVLENHPRQTMPRDQERLGPREVGAVQQAQVLRSVGASAFSFCAVFASHRELLQESMQKQFVVYFQTALAQEKHLPAVHSVVESLRLFSAIGLRGRKAWPEGAGIPGGEPSKFTWRLSAIAGAGLVPRLRR